MLPRMETMMLLAKTWKKHAHAWVIKPADTEGYEKARKVNWQAASITRMNCRSKTDGVPEMSKGLFFHRRSRGRNRSSGWIQFSVGVGLGCCRRNAQYESQLRILKLGS